MKKNVGSQVIGAQMVNATTGAAFTSAVTVYVTGDGGTQAAGSVGSGACTHEGNGFHTYVPAQAETNYDHIAFTFTGTGAVPATVQVYPSFPQTVDNATNISAIKTKTDSLTFTVAGVVDANTLRVGGTVQTARDIGASVLLSAGTGTGQLDFTSGVVKGNVTQLLGTAWLTPGTAGTPDVNVKLWNGLTTVALPLVPTTAGRTLDVSAGGEAGVDWANVGSPTTSLNLSGTTIATTQKVDVETIKTNPVVNGGTLTFPSGATLASTTNITAGTITTATNLTNAPTSGDLTAAMKASVNAEVVDALNVDTYAEPGQESPGATVSLVKKIGYLYKAFRNRSTQTATAYKLYADDATTVDQKATVSDDGTTFDRTEVATGP